MALFNVPVRGLALLVVALLAWWPASWAQALDPPVPSSLHATDSQPLASRVPLVLVHGINPDPDAQYGWRGFLAHSAAAPGFNRYYKVYLFVFDPSLPVTENSRNLQAALHALADPLPPERPMRIAALSLGGMLVRMALADPGLQRHVDRFIAIGVPFHGSPLANPQWIRAQVKKDAPFSLLRLVNRVAYWETRRRFPNFMADFCWDNFDGAIPDSIRQKAPCQATDYGPDRLRVPTILYAGYFGASNEHQHWIRNYLSLADTAPQAKKRRGTMLSRHMMFRMVQPAISGLPLARHASGSDAYPPLWAFNDGISPISSQLWLGRFVQSSDGTPVSTDALWGQVARLRADGGHRLFVGLDHRDWLEGKTRNARTNVLKDLLHPDAPGRGIFDWLLADLDWQTPLPPEVGAPASARAAGR